MRRATCSRCGTLQRATTITRYDGLCARCAGHGPTSYRAFTRGGTTTADTRRALFGDRGTMAGYAFCYTADGDAHSCHVASVRATLRIPDGGKVRLRWPTRVVARKATRKGVAVRRVDPTLLDRAACLADVQRAARSRRDASETFARIDAAVALVGSQRLAQITYRLRHTR